MRSWNFNANALISSIIYTSWIVTATWENRIINPPKRGTVVAPNVKPSFQESIYPHEWLVFRIAIVTMNVRIDQILKYSTCRVAPHPFTWCLLRQTGQQEKTGSSSPILEFIDGVLVRLLMTRPTNVCVSCHQHVSLLHLPETTRSHRGFILLFHLDFTMFVCFVYLP
jgi:hypothetical protein